MIRGGAEFLDSSRRLAYIPPTMLKAILTDSHFWIPVAVLILGTVLLVSLR
jgi:hypothetical protein